MAGRGSNSAVSSVDRNCCDVSVKGSLFIAIPMREGAHVDHPADHTSSAPAFRSLFNMSGSSDRHGREQAPYNDRKVIRGFNFALSLAQAELESPLRPCMVGYYCCQVLRV